jgi:AraC-like DNA-binding protein
MDINVQGALEHSNKNEETSKKEALLSALSSLVETYLEKHPHLSLMALSQRCDVSEPTLRRIKNKDFKSLPTATTILNLVSYIAGEKEIPKLTQRFYGPIGDYLNEVFPGAKDHNRRFDPELNKMLKNDVYYLIYKLCCHPVGLSKERATRLFGNLGEKVIKNLLDLEYIEQRGGRYHTLGDWFATSPGDIAGKIKILTDFMKFQDHPTDLYLTPINANYSSSVNSKAYREVVKLQRNCLKKIRKVLQSESSRGNIPLFMFSAIDTLDTKFPDGDFDED